MKQKLDSLKTKRTDLQTQVETLNKKTPELKTILDEKGTAYDMSVEETKKLQESEISTHKTNLDAIVDTKLTTNNAKLAEKDS